MRFRAGRDEFAEAVSWVVRTLPARPPVPVLGGVLICASEGNVPVTIDGFDYETSARVELAAEVAEEGQILVSGKLLADIAKALPAKPVDVALEGSRVTITCGASRFTLPTMPVEDYPSLPQQPSTSGAVASASFAEAVGQVAVAAGTDDTLPMLTAIRVEVDGETMTLAATDRFRLAVRTLQWNPREAGRAGSVLVPAKILADAAKNSGSLPEIRLALGEGGSSGGEGLLGIDGSGRRITTRLLDSEFPPFRRLLPTEHSAIAHIEVAPLMEALRRVALVAERGAQIKMDFASGQLLLAAGGDDEGRAEESLPVNFAGTELSIAFNHHYLLAGLSALHSDVVAMGFTTPARPAVLRPANKDGEQPQGDGPFAAEDTEYIYLLMPVRLPG